MYVCVCVGLTHTYIYTTLEAGYISAHPSACGGTSPSVNASTSPAEIPAWSRSGVKRRCKEKV